MQAHHFFYLRQKLGTWLEVADSVFLLKVEEFNYFVFKDF